MDTVLGWLAWRKRSSESFWLVGNIWSLMKVIPALLLSVWLLGEEWKLDTNIVDAVLCMYGSVTCGARAVYAHCSRNIFFLPDGKHLQLFLKWREAVRVLYIMLKRRKQWQFVAWCSDDDEWMMPRMVRERLCGHFLFIKRHSRVSHSARQDSHQASKQRQSNASNRQQYIPRGKIISPPSHSSRLRTSRSRRNLC
jgi:hypothetical protein